MQQLIEEIKKDVVNQLDIYKEYKDEEIVEIIDDNIITRSKSRYISIEDKRHIQKTIFNSIRRYDILQDLIEDSDITEIMINGYDNIFFEKKGCIIPWDERFESDKKLEDIIQQIVSRSNRIVNESNPIVDARLEDGSRVNIVLPPVSLSGPVVTIRKFPEEPISIKDLIGFASLTKELAIFLERLVIAGYNIFISGGTGSGKTTFLNVLSNFIPNDERVITIEDSAELQIRNIKNLVRLEVRMQILKVKTRFQLEI